MEKLKTVNELYIKRSDLKKYYKYLTEVNSLTSLGLLSRCRAQYNIFTEEYLQLVLKLTDNSRKYSFDEGMATLNNMKSTARDLLLTIGSATEPWLIIDNLAQDLSSPLFRTPAVAAYVGLCALLLDQADPEDFMLATLISNLGLLKLSSDSLGKTLEKFSEDDTFLYLNHP